ncbi:MAG: MMPL family transporter, partial [Tissierellia bacterium]|nr:MMPL family transporter [Tissierellia bacterium]
NREEIQSKLNALIISEGDPAVQEQLKLTLNQLNSEIETMELEKASLEEKKKGIAVSEAEIAQGKSTLKAEMDKARTQLNQGENKLNESIDEFEKKREEAFNQASLDGVISKEMISGILTAQNFSMPSGYISSEGMDYLVKIGDKIENIDEIKNLMLFDTGEKAVGKIYLKDVADINNKDNSDKIYAKINGNNAVMLTFQKQSNFSTREVTANINEKMAKLTSENLGLFFTNLMDQGIYIDMVVSSVLKNVIYGGILAIVILLIFLRDLKPTLIIAVSIPISIIFAIAMMYFTGITINVISLAGLALGVGMLVDNSIVVIENIYRMRNEGESAKKAAVEGAREVAGALMASTLTTACVFLPIVFTKGLSRELFTDMGLTIAYSLFASLLVALALVPAMASGMLVNIKERGHNVLDKFIGVYEKALSWSLNHKSIVMVMALGLFLFSGYLAINMGTSFIPEMETPQMSLSLKMPEGSSLQDLRDMSDKVLDRIINIEGIETIGAFQNQMMGPARSNTETMSMYLILDEDQKINNKEIEKEIKKSTADLDCEISVATSNMDMSALGGTGIEVLVKGREFEDLREIALDISKILEDTEGTIDVSAGRDDKSREMKVIVDKEKAMEKGLTVAQVFKEINSVISGK